MRVGGPKEGPGRALLPPSQGFSWKEGGPCLPPGAPRAGVRFQERVTKGLLREKPFGVLGAVSGLEDGVPRGTAAGREGGGSQEMLKNSTWFTGQLCVLCTRFKSSCQHSDVRPRKLARAGDLGGRSRAGVSVGITVASAGAVGSRPQGWGRSWGDGEETAEPPLSPGTARGVGGAAPGCPCAGAADAVGSQSGLERPMAPGEPASDQVRR